MMSGHPILSGMIQSIRTFRSGSVARCNIFTVRIKRTRINLAAGSTLLVHDSRNRSCDFLREIILCELRFSLYIRGSPHQEREIVCCAA